MGLKHGEESEMERWPLIGVKRRVDHEVSCVPGTEHMLRKCLVNNV